MNPTWLWTILFLLGAYHGLNPAMGWLFAVALGMQEKSTRAVVHSLLPLGVGHLASVAVVVLASQLAQFTLPLGTVRIVTAAALIGFGVYRLIRRRHPRWVGMRVSPRDLTLWSFLMASAHGAGLMLLPFLLAVPQQSMHSSHLHHMMFANANQAMGAPAPWWMPVGVHTLGYLVASASIALFVYYKLGVAVLRRAWFNLDYAWVTALVAMGGSRSRKPCYSRGIFPQRRSPLFRRAGGATGWRSSSGHLLASRKPWFCSSPERLVEGRAGMLLRCS